MEKIDQKDLSLIEELLKDAKLSEAGLARKTRIPMTTVHNRLRKLRDLGVIKGYTIRLDHEKINRPLAAYVLVKATGSADRRGLLDYVCSLKSVCEAALIAGEFDILLKVRVSTLSELDGFMQDLARGKDVSDSRVMISYDTREMIF